MSLESIYLAALLQQPLDQLLWMFCVYAYVPEQY
jgi:hypothetical protein